MKKIMFFMAAAFAFGSCQQDKIVEQTSNNLSDEGYLIQAVLGNDASSRVNIDGYKVKWAEGDAFSAFGELGDKADCGLKSGTAGEAEGTFMSPMDPQEIVYAVFPAKSTPEWFTGTDGDSVRLTLPGVYSLSDNSQNAPMYGMVDFNDNKVKFNHLTALLKVKYTGLPEGYNTLKFKSKSSISGVFKMPMPNDDNVLVLDSKGSTEVKVSRADNKGEFYLPLPAGKLAELHISALDDKNREIQLISLMNADFEKGKLYTINKKYNPIVIPEPSAFVEGGHSTQGNFVAGWTKNVKFDASNTSLELEDNLDPSLIWSKSIKFTRLAQPSKFNSTFAYEFENIMDPQLIKPQLYKLSFKINNKQKDKISWRISNNTDRTEVDPKDQMLDTFPIVLNSEGAVQARQAKGGTNGKFEYTYVFVDFSRNGYGNPYFKGPFGSVTPDLLKHITIMFFDNKSTEGDVTLISDLQLTEVVGRPDK